QTCALPISGRSGADAPYDRSANGVVGASAPERPARARRAERTYKSQRRKSSACQLSSPWRILKIKTGENLSQRDFQQMPFRADHPLRRAAQDKERRRFTPRDG